MRLSLRTWLFFTLTAATALPVGVLGLHQARRWRAQQISQAEQQTLFAAQAAAREVGQAMDAQLKALSTLSAQLEGLPPEQLRAALREHQRRHGGLSTLQVLGVDGRLVASVPESAKALPTATEARVTVSAAAVGEDGEPALTLYGLLSDGEGSPAGTVAVQLPTVALAGLVSQISAEFDGLDVTLLDAEQHVLAHPDEEVRLKAPALTGPLYQPGGETLRRGADVSGRATHAAVVPIRMLGLEWTAIASRPATAVEAIADDAQRQTLWASLLAVAFGLALALGLATWLAAPMSALARYAVRVGSGERGLSAPKVGRLQPAEISSVMREVSQMVERLETSMREVQQTHEQLLRSGKMAAVGQLAAGMAHEMNNPLFIIIGFAQALKKRLAAAPAAQVKAVDGIVQAADRCKALVHDLLVLSRPGAKTNEIVDAGDVLRQAYAAVAARAESQGIALDLDAEAGLPLVRGSASQLKQVLEALSTNALDATPRGGKVTLTARPRPAGGVTLGVLDTGAGMTPEVKERMFEPFFTTRPVGQRTGLGLSIVFELVRQHDGTIHVDTSPAAGTRVTIDLPGAPLAPVTTSTPEVSKGANP